MSAGNMERQIRAGVCGSLRALRAGGNIVAEPGNNAKA
jgi:hypothetical protein